MGAWGHGYKSNDNYHDYAYDVVDYSFKKIEKILEGYKIDQLNDSAFDDFISQVIGHAHVCEGLDSRPNKEYRTLAHKLIDFYYNSYTGTNWDNPEDRRSALKPDMNFLQNILFEME